jgi:uncharacterized damage-inducible protein DinB
MDHIARLKRQFRHDLIANLATLRSLEAMSSPPDRAVDLMAHIAASQSVWQSRLGIEAVQPLPVWPSLSLSESRPLLEKLSTAWQDALAGADDAWLGSTIEYSNTSGHRFHNTVADVLAHVTHHGAYHRGQIALLVRQMGGQPAVTDFIFSARTGELD